MNKAKKILSVILCLAVLICGFSATFSAFKPALADLAWTKDYTTLSASFDSWVIDDVLFAQQSAHYKATAYTEFGFNSINGIRIESSAADSAGFKVSDTFFSSRFPSNKLGKYESADEFKAYVTYTVAPGTAFRMQYLEYTDSMYIEQELMPYGELEIHLSLDGVNYIPANADYSSKKYSSSYDLHTAFLPSVGAARYVKVVFPQSTTDVTKTYVPQDAFILQKVAYTEGTGLNDNEIKLTTTDADTSWAANFLPAVSGQTSGIITGSVSGQYYLKSSGYNIGRYSDYNGKVWGTVSEATRSIMLRVQPDTRFSLRVQELSHYLNQIRAALLSQGKTAEESLVEFKVLTSSGDGKWTEHRAAPQTVTVAGSNTLSATSYDIDFVVPAAHTYAKIVFPLEGAGNKVEIWENGEFTGSYTGDSSGVGDDLVKMQAVTYTPFNEETAYTYADSLNYVHSAKGQGFDGISTGSNWFFSIGAVDAYNYDNVLSFNEQAFGISPRYNNMIKHKLGSDTELTDAQLPYFVYEVQEETYFTVNTYMRRSNNNLSYNLENHDQKDGKGNFEFAVYTSDSLDGIWTKQSALSLSHLDYVTSTTSDNYYDLTAFIPDGAKYAKVVFGLRGATKITYNGTSEGSSWMSFGDAVGIRGIKYTAKSEGYESVWYNDWLCGDSTTVTKQAPNSTMFLDEDIAAGITVSNTVVNNKDYFRYGMASNWFSSGPSANPYTVYKVNPGTEFYAWAVTGVDYHNTRASDGIDWEIKFYTAATNTTDTVWTEAFVTDTKVKEQGRFDFHNVAFDIPENHIYVKVLFPNLGKPSSGDQGDQQAVIPFVSYVPFGYSKTGSATYDYKDTTIGTIATSIATQTEALGIHSATDGIVFNEVASYQGINVPNGSLNTGWGTKGPFEVIYAVSPGTVFSADLYLASCGVVGEWAVSQEGYNKQTMAHLAGEPWEFTISAAPSLDSSWKNVVDTSKIAAKEITLDYAVPADCNFVKITFPQKGNVSTTCNKCDMGDKTYHVRTQALTGNDLARLRKVTYVPYKCTDYLITNDYTAKNEGVISDKTDYRLYDFFNVSVGANGIVAEEEGGYVIYKTSDLGDLVVKSNSSLNFSISYDGKNYVDAKIISKGGYYTVPKFNAKTYVKVSIDEGETIESVKTDLLPPTATFVNKAGTKIFVELEAYGDTPVVPTVTKRIGYVLTGWDRPVNVGIYSDTVYTAQYAKDTSKQYTVKLDDTTAAMGATISYPANVTETTVRFDDRIKITAPTVNSEGEVFDFWKDENGCKIANSHTFSFLANGNVTLTAVYSVTKSTADPFIYNTENAVIYDNGNGTFNMSVIWRTAVPSGITVKETGIILGKTNDVAVLKANGEGTFKLVHSGDGTNRTLSYTVNNIKEGASRYALPYAVLSDGTTIYGVVASKESTVNDIRIKAIGSEIAESDDYMITFVGDSVTWGDGKSSEDKTYPAQVAYHLAKLFPDREIIRYDGVMNGQNQPLASYDGPITMQEGANGKITVVRSGVGSSTAASTITRMDADFIGDANGRLPRAADLIVIHLGINDYGNNHTTEQYKANLKTIIDKIRAAQPDTTIVLMTPTSCAANSSGTAEQNPLNPYSDTMKALAAEEGLAYIDMHKLWMDHYVQGGDMFGMGDWHHDRWHPTEIGYAAMADKIILDLFG